MVGDNDFRVHCWVSDATGQLDKLSQNKRKNRYMNHRAAGQTQECVACQLAGVECGSGPAADAPVPAETLPLNTASCTQIGGNTAIVMGLCCSRRSYCTSDYVTTLRCRR